MIPKDEIQVWFINIKSLSGFASRIEASLSEEEWARANRFISNPKRKEFISGRGMLRIILGNYLNSNPADILFEFSKKGKPFIDIKNGGEFLNFNISHSGEYLLFAFTSSGTIGVDLEKVNTIPDIKNVAEKAFSEEEIKMLDDLPVENFEDAFYKCWTMKEAYYKTGQIDFLVSPTDFTVDFISTEPSVTIQGISRAENTFGFLFPDSPNGYKSAIAINNKSARIIYRDISSL